MIKRIAPQKAQHSDDFIVQVGGGYSIHAAIVAPFQTAVDSVMTLSAMEFVWRLLLHVLPTGFMRIRNYSILANRHRREKLASCSRLLGSGSVLEPESPESKPITEIPSSISPTRVCPVCGAGRMIIIEEFPPLPAGQEAHESICGDRNTDGARKKG
jgi:hypothetical protein